MLLPSFSSALLPYLTWYICWLLFTVVDSLDCNKLPSCAVVPSVLLVNFLNLIVTTTKVHAANDGILKMMELN